MLTCPMCKKTVRPISGRECPTCRTDLSLLVDYVDHVEEGLARAEALTREGELGEAVWAYLAVLETDPDNPTARRQVGQVAAAVRQFDRIAVGRRMMDRLRRRARFRQWAEGWADEGRGSMTAVLLVAALAVVAAFVFGVLLGLQSGPPGAPTTPAAPDRQEAPAEGERAP